MRKSSLLLLISLLAILSACSTRKVSTNKSIAETKIFQQSEAKEVTDIKSGTISLVASLDTSKVVSENKTVIEVFNSDGSLAERITSISKSIESNYKRFDLVQKDSTASTQIKTSKDVIKVDSKVTNKTKQTSASRLGFAWLCLFLGVVGVGYFLAKKLKC